MTTARTLAWQRTRKAGAATLAEFWRSTPGRIGIIVLGVFVLMAVAAPLISSQELLNPVAARSSRTSTMGNSG